MPQPFSERFCEGFVFINFSSEPKKGLDVDMVWYDKLTPGFLLVFDIYLKKISKASSTTHF